MMPNILTQEMLATGLMPFGEIVLSVSAVLIVEMVVGVISRWVIKTATQFCCGTMEFSQRQTRRTIKRVENAVDLVLTLNDLSNVNRK